MWRKEYLVSLLILAALFLIGQYFNIMRLWDFFPAFDPYYHYAITQQYINQHSYSSFIQQAILPTEIVYTTLQYILSQSAHYITGVPLNRLSSLWWPLLMLFSMLFIASSIRRVGWWYFGALVWAILWLTSPYILGRHSMFLPENIALLLLAFLCYSLILKRYWLSCILIFVYWYIHYRSWYVPLAYYAFYQFVVWLLACKKLTRKSIKDLCMPFLPLILVFVFAYPVNLEFWQSLRYMLKWFLGLEVSRSEVAPDKTLYAIPTIFSFMEQVWWRQAIGILMSVLFCGVWLIYTRRQRSEHFPFMVSILCITLLLLACYFSPLVAKHVPSYRFATYIMLFGSIVVWSVVPLVQFRFQKILLWSVLCIFLIPNLFASYGRTWITPGDRNAIDIVQEKFPESGMIGIWGSIYTLHPFSEWDPAFLSRVLYVKTNEELMTLLQSRYGGVVDSIVIVLSTNQMKSETVQQAILHAILQKYELVYEDEEYYSQAYYILLSDE